MFEKIDLIFKQKNLKLFFCTRLLVVLSTALSFFVFPTKALSNYSGDEKIVEPGPKTMGLEFPNGETLLYVPDMEYSQEEFESISNIEQKTLALGKQMIKLQNLVNEPETGNPEYNFRIQELFREDIEAIVLKEISRSREVTSDVLIEHARENLMFLNQRVALDKALDQLLTWHSLSYFPGEEFLSDNILHKIAQRFDGLGAIAQSMAIIVREELDFNKSRELVEAAANSLFWTGIEIGEMTSERTTLSTRLTQINSELADATRYQRQNFINERALVSNSVAIHTMLIDSMLASQPWFYFLDTAVTITESDNPVTLMEFIWEYTKLNMEQNQDYDPNELVLIKETIIEIVLEQAIEAKNRTKDFIEAILTGNEKYIAPLMTLRAETLDTVNQVLLEQESHNNIPTLQDYRMADYKMSQRFGFTANKFHALRWQEVATDIGIAIGSAAAIKFYYRGDKPVKTYDVKQFIKNNVTNNKIRRLFFPPTKAWTEHWWGRLDRSQLGKIQKGTPWIIVAQGGLYTIRFVTKKRYRTKLIKFLPDAMWAGVVSKSYASMAQIGYKDLWLNAVFDVLGTFTMTRWFKHLTPKGVRNATVYPFKKSKVLLLGDGQEKKGLIGAIKALTDAIKGSITKPSHLVKRLYPPIVKFWRNRIALYFKEAAFVLGSLLFVMDTQLGRMQRPDFIETIARSFRGEEPFPEKILKTLKNLLYAAKVGVFGDRQALLDNISIVGVDATFIFFANRGAVATHNMAALYAGGTAIFESLGQLLSVRSENKNNPYFSNRSDTSLLSKPLDRVGWERIWAHLGYVSSFSIAKFLMAYLPIRTTGVAMLTHMRASGNLNKFRKFVGNSRFPERRLQYGHLLQGVDDKAVKTLMKNPALTKAIQEEIITRQKPWLLAEFAGSFMSNGVGNFVFISAASKLEQTRVEGQSLSPEIIKWTKNTLEEEELDHDHVTLNGLYDDVSKDIAILKLLRSEAEDQARANLEQLNEPDAN